MFYGCSLFLAPKITCGVTYPAPSVTDLQCRSKQLQRHSNLVNIWLPIFASQTDKRQETAVYDHHKEDKEG